jgi:4-hydroxyphenylpyruvate dioxygenase
MTAWGMRKRPVSVAQVVSVRFQGRRSPIRFIGWSAMQVAAFHQAVGPGELDIPAIRGLGDSLVYFTDAHSELARVWEIEFDPVDVAPIGPFERIDHIAQSMSPDEMLSWRLWYLSLFDLGTTPQVDVIDPAGIVESMALQDAARAVRICLNTSASERTLSSRFLHEFFGAGVQHIAFATGDIFASSRCRSPTTTTTISRRGSGSSRS